MADNTTPVYLRDTHARAVATTLRLVEQALFLIEDLAAGDQIGAIVATRTDLDAERRARIEEIIQAARGEIAALAQTFGLPHHERDGRQIIQGHLSELWADLEDTRPAKLGRYGAVDPALVPLLDPPIVRLIACIEAIRAEVLR